MTAPGPGPVSAEVVSGDVADGRVDVITVTLVDSGEPGSYTAADAMELTTTGSC